MTERHSSLRVGLAGSGLPYQGYGRGMDGAFIEHARLLVVYMYEQCTNSFFVPYICIPPYSIKAVFISSRNFKLGEELTFRHLNVSRTFQLRIASH